MPQLGSILLLMLLLMSDEEDGESSFRSQLELRFRRLRSGKIRRDSLEYPNASAFAKLFRSRQDDALVTLCGFDHHSFHQLNTLFAPQYDGHSPYVFRGRLIVRHNRKKGGRRLLTSSQCLALVLAWTRTRGSMAVLQMIFGVTASSLSMWLRFGRRMLLLAIRTHPHAVVCLPTEDELQSFVDAVALKYPALVNCWGAMDGLKIRLRRLGIQEYKTYSTMGGRMTTTFQIFFCFHLMGKFVHATSTVLVTCMIQQWPSGVGYMTRWMISTELMG
jgi:hypothetical protein